MTRTLLVGLLAWLLLAPPTWSQEHGLVPLPPSPGGSTQAANPADEAPPMARLLALQEELSQNSVALGQALAAQDKTVDPKEVERLQKQVELLQKQIEVLQKLVQLLADQLKKQPPAGPAAAAMQAKTAALDARSLRAAQRDVDLANAVDDLREQVDAIDRRGPTLPATLKEMFFPTQTNETPLSIYGSFIENFTQFNGKPGVFSSPDFAPFFFIQLNEQWLLAASIDINNSGVGVGEAQINWFVNDWLTVVGGRYLTPIGFFNERLNHEWINRLPDAPLMFRQVSPLTSNDGLMLRGATYLWGSPVKMEYCLYGGNGLQAGTAPTSLNEVANLQNITGGPDETSLTSLGGRLGLWIPEWGLTGGVSTYFNGKYSTAAPDQFNLWQLDLGWHYGDWDLRFEFCDNYQQATSYIGNNIHRRGFYAQAAYRPYQLANPILRNFELAVRYSRVWFKGIDPTMLDPTTFDTPVDVPVNRDQYTVGINYYFYASMALRLAYEINHEFSNVNLHDNVFLGQFVWAF
jgi:hypothetical protein